MTESGGQHEVRQPLPDPPPSAEGVRRVIGCMTGTSLDGLDCALVEISGHGLSMRAKFVRGNSVDLGAVKPRLRAVADQAPVTAGDIAGVMRDFALLHADAVRELLAGETCDLVCVHGQTVFHKPPLSWQLFQPAPLVRALQVPVVYDLRQADLAMGGQGAPITPVADWVLFRDRAPAAVVNLGGFCNVTHLARPRARKSGESEDCSDIARIEARDVCACNQLLDAVARACLGTPFDTGGKAALTGRTDDDALCDLEDLVSEQMQQHRSLGTGDELELWVARHRGRVSPADLCATACESVAAAISGTVENEETILLAGGGARNAALVRFLSRMNSHAVVQPLSAVGVPGEFREGACFAVLGALCQDRVPITMPQVTKLPAGVAAPLSGVWAFP